MNEQNKSLIKLLILTQLILVVGIFLYFKAFSTNIRISEGRGKYAFSPNNQWMAMISDAYNKDNDLNYAVIYLWDVNKYPSLLRQRIGSTTGKKPKIKLVFPKDFNAGGRSCKIKWINSNIFEIEFFMKDSQEVFRYDIPQNVFQLYKKNENL